MQVEFQPNQNTPLYQIDLMPIVERWSSDHRLSLSAQQREMFGSWLRETSAWGMSELLLDQLGTLLSQFPNLAAGLERFTNFLNNARNPRAFIAFLERDRDALPVLMRFLSVPSVIADWTAASPDIFDWLRRTAGVEMDANSLADELISEIQGFEEELEWTQSMRSFRKRHVMRIAFAYSLQGMHWSTVQNQLSALFDAAVRGSIFASKLSSRSRNQPSSTAQLHIGALAIGQVGSRRVDFLNDLNARWFVWLDESSTKRFASMDDECNRIANKIEFFLTDRSSFGYSVFKEPSLKNAVDLAQQNVLSPRQWILNLNGHSHAFQRLEFISARPIDYEESNWSDLQSQLNTFAYRSYLSAADKAELMAEYRRLQGQVNTDLSSWETDRRLPVSILSPWIEWMDFVFRIIHLASRGKTKRPAEFSPENALAIAIDMELLTSDQSEAFLQGWNAANDAWVRVQIELPSPDVELGLPKAASMQKSIVDCGSGSIEFLGDAECQNLVELIQATGESAERILVSLVQSSPPFEPMTQWLLEYAPDKVAAHQWLLDAGFKHPESAFERLQELASEEGRILSNSRCRFYLSQIAPKLLFRIAQTPTPDLTLENLCSTSRTLGGKGVLWELFLTHEPSLDLYVRLCGSSPYLVSILLNNPGMIDELLDSLMLQHLPSEETLEKWIEEMGRGVEKRDLGSVEPILVAFKNAMHLNVGVRNILGKDSVEDSHRSLTAIADVCVRQAIDVSYVATQSKLGVPQSGSGKTCPFSVFAFGKFGGSEPNYHSDLPLLFVFESDGFTKGEGPAKRSSKIANEEFFHQLAQKCLQLLNKQGPGGRLFESKPVSFKVGNRSPLAWSLMGFRDFVRHNPLTPLQRMAFVQGRTVFGSPSFSTYSTSVFKEILSTAGWDRADDHFVLKERSHLETSAAPENMKRGKGGTLDVEWLTQVLVLRNSLQYLEPAPASTTKLLHSLARHQLLPESDAEQLSQGYLFLRRVESGLRLLNTTDRHDLPQETSELNRLAYVLRMESGAELVGNCEKYRHRNRQLFEKHLHG